jgi:hypothetical protein
VVVASAAQEDSSTDFAIAYRDFASPTTVAEIATKRFSTAGTSTVATATTASEDYLLVLAIENLDDAKTTANDDVEYLGLDDVTETISAWQRSLAQDLAITTMYDRVE